MGGGVSPSGHGGGGPGRGRRRGAEILANQFVAPTPRQSARRGPSHRRSLSRRGGRGQRIRLGLFGVEPVQRPFSGHFEITHGLTTQHDLVGPSCDSIGRIGLASLPGLQTGGRHFTRGSLHCSALGRLLRKQQQ